MLIKKISIISLASSSFLLSSELLAGKDGNCPAASASSSANSCSMKITKHPVLSQSKLVTETISRSKDSACVCHVKIYKKIPQAESRNVYTQMDYRTAKANRKIAKRVSAVSEARGEELETEEKPFHPGKGRAFGYYRCQCGSKWNSAYSWADETQECKNCGCKVLPYKQKALDHNVSSEEANSKPHMQELCSKCQKLGRRCTLSMELSKSSSKLNDVYVSGLAIDVTDSQLIDIFSPYGAILRVNIPCKQEGKNYKYAFITFQNPKSALEKFNAVKCE